MGGAIDLAEARLLPGPLRDMRQPGIGEGRHYHLALALAGHDFQESHQRQRSIGVGDAVLDLVQAGKASFQVLDQRAVVRHPP